VPKWMLCPWTYSWYCVSMLCSWMNQNLYTASFLAIVLVLTVPEEQTLIKCYLKMSSIFLNIFFNLACPVWRSTKRSPDAVEFEIRLPLWPCPRWMRWTYSAVRHSLCCVCAHACVCNGQVWMAGLPGKQWLLLSEWTILANTQFNESLLTGVSFVALLDYRFLEDTGRLADSANRDSLVRGPPVNFRVSHSSTISHLMYWICDIFLSDNSTWWGRNSHQPQVWQWDRRGDRQVGWRSRMMIPSIGLTPERLGECYACLNRNIDFYFQNIFVFLGAH
jgi:hypothetical protein